MKPLPTLGGVLKRGIRHRREFGHPAAEIIVEVAAEVVHDVMNNRIRRMGLDMFGEHSAQRMSIMIPSTPAEDSAGGRIEEGEQIGGAVTQIVEVLEPRLSGLWRQVRRQTFESLDAGAFVKTIQVFGRIQIEINNMFHLGKEIRIGYLQIVAAAVRLQRMFSQDSLYGRAADGTTYRLRVLLEMLLCVAQRPVIDSR